MGLSLRTKLVLIVLGGAVLPLALFGLWLTGTAERSAEELLRARLRSSLSQIVDQIGGRWLSHRSGLLQLCESPAVQRALVEDPLAPGGLEDDAARELVELHRSLREQVPFVAFRDRSGTVRWRLEPDSSEATGLAGPVPRPALPVTLNVYENRTGDLLGTAEAHIRMTGLLPEAAAWGGVSGAVLAVFDPTSGAPLLPMSIDPALLERERFVWAQEPWLTEGITLQEPAMVLALAAPLGPFLEPFQEAARRNLTLLVAVAIGGVILATLMSWPITRALAQLAAAAERVSQGDLDQRVEQSRADEVGRVARAFNSMTENLRQTLQKLSQREALASVGEFASALAHEVRNPLTSIRVDLQRAEEELPRESQVRDLLSRALEQIERVDRSVTGALRVARSGHIEHETVDVRQPLLAATHEAAPRFDAVGGTLEPAGLEAEPVWVVGNSAALEQLFLNLLLNAAEALDVGGRAGIDVEHRDDRLRMSFWDTGRGIEAEVLDRVFDPFYSTKAEGTGLGLAISQRIALAHGSGLRIESSPGRGTRVELDLPLAEGTQGA
jgi:signal transduction histidine kinase